MDGPDSGQGTSEECALQGQRLAEQGLYHMETLLVTSELPMEGAACAEEDLVVAIFKDYVLVFSALRGCACKLLEGLKQ